MKKYNTTKLIITLGISCFLTGCAGLDERREFAKGANYYANQILPEYDRYIDRDANLESESKRIRKQTAEEFKQYISNGMKNKENTK